MRLLIDGQTLSTPEMQRGIGLVFARLLEEMVVPEISIRWFVAVKDESAIAKLSSQAGQAVEPIIVPGFQAKGDPIEWGRVYGQEIQKIVDRIRPDWYWNPNPLMSNVHFPFGLRGARTAWTLHDLIPLAFPDWYLNKWPLPFVEDYLARIEEMSQRADVILPVSRFSGQDFMHRFPKTTARIMPVHWASDYSLMYPLRGGIAKSEERYVLYVGGFDPRKNMEGAISAFASLRAGLADSERIGAHLKIVCPNAGLDAERLRALAVALGIGDAIELTGYVPDERLGQLLRSAVVFFFPSFSEGFGLPVLDAMACGIPVVAGNNSSIPEIVGEHAFLADSGDTFDLAAKLRAAWEARCKRPGAWHESARYARANFDWRKSADRYLAIFREAETTPVQVPAVHTATRAPIAYLSPWPPQHTGVADYSYRLVRHLAARAPITVFTDAKHPVALEGVEIRPIHEFQLDCDRFPRRIYQLGNGWAHCEIYRIAWDNPGVIVIHDYNIHPFLTQFFLLAEKPEAYQEALLAYGERGADAWRRFELDRSMPSTWEFPMIDPIASRSRGAIVHSRWVARRLQCAGNVSVTHLGADVASSTSEADRLNARSELGLLLDSHYVGAFGFINSHKRIEVVAHAVGDLRARGYPVVLLLVGEINDSRVDLHELRVHHGLENGGMIHVDYVSEGDYERYLSAIDVLVNLRYPTMGESSGSLFRAFGCGIPSVVSDVGQFAELPSDTAWKVEVGGREVAVLTAYLAHLLQHPDSRRALGVGGQRFVERFASLEHTAEAYLRSCDNA